MPRVCWMHSDIVDSDCVQVCMVAMPRVCCSGDWVVHVTYICIVGVMCYDGVCHTCHQWQMLCGMCNVVYDVRAETLKMLEYV